MEVYRHFIITVVASTALLVASGHTGFENFLMATAYAVAVGVFMDLDHFLLAWSGSGDFTELKKAFRNPTDAFTDAGKIFERGVFTPRARFLSHFSILYLASGISYLISTELAAFTAVIISLHILADFYAHIRTHGLPATPLSPESLRKRSRDQYQDG